MLCSVFSALTSPPPVRVCLVGFLWGFGSHLQVFHPTAKMLVELEQYSQGKGAGLFHRHPEQVSGFGTVVKKNQNVMVIRMGMEPRYALKILDSVPLTDDPNYQSYDETFEVGDAVNFHALLMDTERVVQSLCTAAWSAVASPRLPRHCLTPVATNLYNTLAASYCADVSELANLDMSGVLVPSTYDAVGFNDIADLAALYGSK